MKRSDRVVVIAAAGYTGLLLVKTALAGLAVVRRRSRLRAAPDETGESRVRAVPDVTRESRVSGGSGATRTPLAPSELTIVQAILSGDPQLVDTLANTLAVAPESPVLWLVDAADPEGRRAAEAASSRHPLAAVRIVDCPACPAATGPKTFKLHLAESLIETEAFAVVDDDTRVTAEGLAALRDGLRIAEVSTGLPCYLPGAGLWSRLLAQFVNDQSTLSYLPTAALGGPRTINGMTWAMRLGTLERLGGFAPLLPFLADDLAVATRVRAAGGTIDQSEVVQFVSTTVDDGRGYGRLMHRWMVFAGLLLKAERPAVRAGIVAGYAVPAVLLGLLVAITVARPSQTTAAALSGTLFVRSAVIAAVQRAVTGRARHDPVLSLAGELMLPVQFGRALADRRIVWRGSRFLVHANDRFEETPR
jgi:ceramide glucosyltransferase